MEKAVTRLTVARAVDCHKITSNVGDVPLYR